LKEDDARPVENHAPSHFREELTVRVGKFITYR
jgi:hypothetical protein